MGIRAYFRGARLVQVSSGTYCVVRDLGLVKGGKGLRHYENLLTLNVRGLASKLASLARQMLQDKPRLSRPLELSRLND